MNAEQIILSVQGLTNEDTEEIQIQANHNITKCLMEVKNGRTN